MTLPSLLYRLLFVLMSVFWMLALILILTLLYLMALLPDEGWLLPLLICAGAGILLSILSSHSLSKYLAARILRPLESLADATRRVTQNKEQSAQTSFVATDQNTYPEVHNLAEEINALARKSGTMLEDMQRLQQVRSQFLGNVSHELRTPIFAVQGYLETLLDGALEDVSVRRNFVEKAYNNTKRLGTLLNDLIDISRIESGEMRMSFRYFNVTDVIRDVVQQLEMYAEQHGVRIMAEEVEEVHVFGDKERIAQVLANLISNAIKYNKPGGSVSVGIRLNADDVTIAVSDTGVGIAPEHHARVFERFYRADTNRSRATGGSGLGLAIVKHILEAHGTPITLQSEVGIGTTMSFSLRR